mgnify:CR=1
MGCTRNKLTQPATDLDQKNKLNHMSSISYALEVDLNCLNADDPKQKSALCLLADRNIVQEEYGSLRATSGMRFFTSPRPPQFLQDHVFAVMK